MAPKTKPVSSLPLVLKYDRAMVSGGYNNSFILAEVRTATVSQAKKTFLKVSNGEPWLLAGVCGYKTARQIGGLTRRTSLVAVLKQALKNACAFRPITAAGSNEATTEAGSNEEPLSDDENLVATALGKTRKCYARRGKGRNRYHTNLNKGRVLQIEMPAIAPDKDPTCTDKRMVSLFCEDRKTLWLAEEDTEWAMTYIQDQLKCNGCLGVADNGPGQGRPPPLP